MLKKTKAILLSAALSMVVTMFAGPAFAEGNTEQFYDPEFDATITPYVTTENGLEPISEEEYAALSEETVVITPESEPEPVLPLPKSGKTGDVVLPESYREYWRYVESSVTTYTGDPIQVTSTIDCTNNTSCTISKNVSSTVSASYSASATAEKDAIRAGVSYTWVSSASDSSIYTFTLKKGDKGYIAFKPTKKKSTGKLKKYSNWDGYLYSKDAYARNPVKLSNGEAKGIYVFVKQ